MTYKEPEHIDWIDGAKGIAILGVILVHCIPCYHEVGAIFHIDQCVPVFVFITAYLSSLHFESIKAYFKKQRIVNMIKKIILPFLIVLLVQLTCFALAGRQPSAKSVVMNGGIGPGSYYIWLYVQMWVIIPFVVWLVRKVPTWASCIIMLAISIIAEYTFVLVQGIENIDKWYRLMPIRYLLVLYLGCIWPILRSKQKYVFYGLASISALMILNNMYLPDSMQIANVLWGGG